MHALFMAPVPDDEEARWARQTSWSSTALVSKAGSTGSSRCPATGDRSSEGVTPLTVAGSRPDPHAWQDLANGRVDVANIARALAAAGPAHAADYRRRAAAYDRELAALDQDIRDRLDAVPGDRRKVITSHDAFRYFGRAYAIDFLAPVRLGTESEPSAGEVAALVRQIDSTQGP